MKTPLYTTDILRLAASLGDRAVLERIDGSAEERSPTCGSRVATRVQFDESGRIVAITQDVHACAFGQAAAALVARHASGLTAADVRSAQADVAAWLAGDREDPGDWADFSILAPARGRRARHPAILLPFRSLVSALGADG